MSPMALIFRYSLFAVIATLANLATQRLVLVSGNSVEHFTAAVAAGTLVGLVIKYILDKKWIFYDLSTGVRAHSSRFMLYTMVGILTTAIFWGFETVFWFIWRTDLMRELGAVIGLGIGYILKYMLDRRFVFTDENLRVNA